jgi:hypothetical protein
MALTTARKSVGVFAVLYIPLAIGAMVFFWITLKPAFDSINAPDAPAASQPAE